MFDRTGKTVQVGQTVDILLNGIFQAEIIAIHEMPMIMPNKQAVQPQVQLRLLLSHVPHDGRNCGFYIISESKIPETSEKSLVQ